MWERDCAVVFFVAARAVDGEREDSLVRKLTWRRASGLALLVAWSTCAGGPVASAQSRGAPRVPPALYPNSWALVVGINRYQNAPGLAYAVADARSVADALPALGFPRENIRLLLNEQATKAGIETTLYRGFPKMGPDDRLLVFFAGHGETLAIRGGEEGYLLPADADADALPLTAIPMDDLKRISQRLKAKHYLFIMDACFSGFAATRDVAPGRPTDDYLAVALREPVVQVITAGRKGERAIEDGGHGLFTRRLLDGLRGLADPDGRGIITAAQLAAWLEPRVVRDSKGKMTPQYGKLDGEGQFVFVRTVKLEAKPDVRPETRVEARPEAKSDAKPESRLEASTGGQIPRADPLTDEATRTAYSAFQKTELARAFAVGRQGGWGSSSKRASRPQAGNGALYSCNKAAHDVCRLYAVNDEVVFTRYAAFDERSRTIIAALRRERFFFSQFGDELYDFGVASPEALRQGNYHAGTPTALRGVSTVKTVDLVKMLVSASPPTLVDALDGDGHKTLPGAFWIRGAGDYAASEDTNAETRDRFGYVLTGLTKGDKTAPLVFFCLDSRCWLSYNAALRARELGYTNLHWYRGGVTAWEAARLDMLDAVQHGQVR